MNIGDFEKKKSLDLTESMKDNKLTDQQITNKILTDIAESLAIIAGKIGRRFF